MDHAAFIQNWFASFYIISFMENKYSMNFSNLNANFDQIYFCLKIAVVLFFSLLFQEDLGIFGDIQKSQRMALDHYIIVKNHWNIIIFLSLSKATKGHKSISIYIFHWLYVNIFQWNFFIVILWFRY